MTSYKLTTEQKFAAYLRFIEDGATQEIGAYKFARKLAFDNGFNMSLVEEARAKGLCNIYGSF